jgi:hypothetical protein
MSQSYKVQHGLGGIRRASIGSDIGRVQGESGNERCETIWKVAQGSKSPDDDGDIGWTAPMSTLSTSRETMLTAERRRGLGRAEQPASRPTLPLRH